MNPERVALVHAAVMGVEVRPKGRKGNWQYHASFGWTWLPPYDERLVFGVWLPRLQADGWTWASSGFEDGTNFQISRYNSEKHARDSGHSRATPHAHEAAGEAIAQAMQVGEGVTV